MEALTKWSTVFMKQSFWYLFILMFYVIGNIYNIFTKWSTIFAMTFWQFIAFPRKFNLPQVKQDLISSTSTKCTTAQRVNSSFFYFSLKTEPWSLHWSCNFSEVYNSSWNFENSASLSFSWKISAPPSTLSIYTNPITRQKL